MPELTTMNLKIYVNKQTGCCNKKLKLRVNVDVC